MPFRKRIPVVYLHAWVVFAAETTHALFQPNGANAEQTYAAKFIDFLVPKEGQALIRSFGMNEFGEGLYNDTDYARQYDH